MTKSVAFKLDNPKEPYRDRVGRERVSYALNNMCAGLGMIKKWILVKNFKD